MKIAHEAYPYPRRWEFLGGLIRFAKILALS